jgi:hypothetical protein
MEPGDYVEWGFDDDNPDVLFVGVIKELIPDTTGAKVMEVHAFHRLWGGSSGMRGDIQTLLTDKDLRPCRPCYKNTVKAGLSAYEKDPAKYDRSRNETLAQEAASAIPVED